MLVCEGSIIKEIYSLDAKNIYTAEEDMYNLWIAVIDRVINDMFGKGLSGVKDKTSVKEQALDYVLYDSDFIQICEIIDIDGYAIRDKIKSMS